jgi:hypothetical protein
MRDCSLIKPPFLCSYCYCYYLNGPAAVPCGRRGAHGRIDEVYVFAASYFSSADKSYGLRAASEYDHETLTINTGASVEEPH